MSGKQEGPAPRLTKAARRRAQRELEQLEKQIQGLRDEISRARRAYQIVSETLCTPEPEKTTIDRLLPDSNSVLASLEKLRAAVARSEALRSALATELPAGQLVFRRRDAAIALGISLSEMDKLIGEATIRAGRLGGRILIHRSEIERVAKNRELGIPLWTRTKK